jgi:hypothetical protein
VSDGTTVGTRMLKDVVPGVVGSFPSLLTVFSPRPQIPTEIFFTVRSHSGFVFGTGGYEVRGDGPCSLHSRPHSPSHPRATSSVPALAMNGVFCPSPLPPPLATAMLSWAGQDDLPVQFLSVFFCACQAGTYVRRDCCCYCCGDSCCNM